MKVGDKVVCVKANSSITKGVIYTILGIQTMSCGCVVIDVGVSDHDCMAFQTNCYEHGASILDWNCIQWFGTERFAPIISRSDEFLSSDKIEKSAEERIDIELPITV